MTCTAWREAPGRSLEGSQSGLRAGPSACDVWHIARPVLGRVGVLSGEGGVLAPVWNDGLGELQTSDPQLLDLLAGEAGVTLLHVGQCLIHPGDLIFPRCSDHAALSNRAEQLIARSLHHRLRLCGPGFLTTLTGQTANLLLRIATGKSDGAEAVAKCHTNSIEI